MLRTCFVAVIATALPACVGTDDTAGSADDSAVDPPPTLLAGSTTDSPPPAAPARIVAAVDDATGGRVEIYAPAGPNEIAVGAGAVYPFPPPVTGEFVMSHDPIEVFLAVAPVGTPVPTALRDAYPQLTVRDDAATRTRLHAELAAQIAAFPKFDEPRERSGSCTNAFIAWFNSVYHDMPGGESGTCSTQGGGTYRPDSAQYKKDAFGYIPIVSEDIDACARQATSCDEWDATFRDYRFGVENLHNDYLAQGNDHDMHTGMATCAGLANFHRQWDELVWDKELMAGQGWQQWVGTFPYQAGPAYALFTGLWDLPLDVRYAQSAVQQNTGSFDRVIWCGNLEDQWAIDDTGCHNWCDFDDSDGKICNITDFCLEQDI
jgi:hypothetical protein